MTEELIRLVLIVWAAYGVSTPLLSQLQIGDTRLKDLCASLQPSVLLQVDAVDDQLHLQPLLQDN